MVRDTVAHAPRRPVLGWQRIMQTNTDTHETMLKPCLGDYHAAQSEIYLTDE